MAETYRGGEGAAGSLDSIPMKAAEAAAALEALREPAERAAASIGDAFGRAGESLARSLGRAASDGQVSMAELARAVIGAVNAGAGGGSGAGGLGAAVAAAVSGLVGSRFSGSRAEGGPVMGGGAYLVGERGPEVFRPAGAGSIEAGGVGPQVTVNLRMDGGAQGLLRSEAQIAQMMARAVSLGARRL